MSKDVQRIVVSENAKSRMVVYKTAVKGMKNRTGKQYWTSVTKHEPKPKK